MLSVVEEPAIADYMPEELPEDSAPPMQQQQQPNMQQYSRAGLAVEEEDQEEEGVAEGYMQSKGLQKGFCSYWQSSLEPQKHRVSASRNFGTRA